MDEVNDFPGASSDDAEVSDQPGGADHDQGMVLVNTKIAVHSTGRMAWLCYSAKRSASRDTLVMRPPPR
jgi:hypothetical protein